MKYVFIINPSAGKSNQTKLKNNIKTVLENEDYEIFETAKPNDATVIAKKFKDDRNVIVYSCGGDGTLNEVVNGLANGKCKLGIIPIGSGNDFYKSLNKYSKKESTIDLGLVNNQRYFINIASIGFDAEVTHNANLIKENGHFKKLSYYLGVLKTLFTYRYHDLEMSINDYKIKGPKTIVAVCNGKYYGGGIPIAPLATFDDDIFDVYYADKMNKLKLIYLFIKLLKAKHENNSIVKKINTTKVLVKAEDEMIINVDGETFKSKIANFEMVKDAINIYNDKELVSKIMKDV